MNKKNPYAFTKQTLKIFWAHTIKYPWQIAVLISGVLTMTSLGIYMPLLYRDLVNLLTSGISEEASRGGTLIVLMIFGANVLRNLLWRASNFVNAHFQARVMADLTNTCYTYLQKHSLGFFNSSFVGSLVTKVKRYERSFEQIADQCYFDLGRLFLEMVMILGILLWQYRTMGLITLGWCVLFLAFAYIYSIYKLPYDVERAAADTHTTAQLADSITNNVNIKLFTSYERENQKFYNVTQDQFLLRKKSWNLGNWGDVVQSALTTILEFVIIYLAVKQWYVGALGVGDIVLLQAYLIRMFDKLWNTGKNIRVIYEALADANEMTEMILAPHEVQDAHSARSLKVGKGEVAFQQVSFTYPNGVPILRDFDLRITPGERVALIGPSGGGKSTIVRLLFRFHDLGGGAITIDGQNIKEVTQDSLRNSLSLVPQDPILFHRSLMENIRYAKPMASDAEVVAAAKLAHAHEFISAFPQQYETLVGERGIKLSGGERQRVAIARAILKDAPILVLDEATSSLDSESEMFIQDALRELMKGRTTIVIAHRLSTIMQMDRIVVIEAGKIVEQGKHKELLKAKRGVYQRLWEIQAGGFAATS